MSQQFVSQSMSPPFLYFLRLVALASLCLLMTGGGAAMAQNKDNAAACKVFIEGRDVSHEAEWSGECVDGYAQGMGRLLLKKPPFVEASIHLKLEQGFLQGEQSLQMDYQPEQSSLLPNHELTFVLTGAFKNSTVIGDGLFEVKGYEADSLKLIISYRGPIQALMPNGIGSLKAVSYNDDGSQTIEWEYSGEVVNMAITGHGRRVRGGFSEEGKFADGELVEGVVWTEAGTRYEGSFSNGKLSGRGEIEYSFGTRKTGIFSNGALNGQGEIEYDFGVREVGAFLNGDLHGSGKTVYPDGSIFEGVYIKGELSSGTWVGPAGKMYEGEFHKFYFHGHGTVKYIDNTECEGEWDMNVLVGEAKGLYRGEPAVCREEDGTLMVYSVDRERISLPDPRTR